jgi:hypothetical protein
MRERYSPERPNYKEVRNHMARYPRKDGGEVNTDYRGRDVRVTQDGTIFVSPVRQTKPSQATPKPSRSANRTKSN